MSKAKTILSVVVAAGLIISATGLTSHAISGISASEARPEPEPIQNETETDWAAYADSLNLAEIIGTADLTADELEHRDGKLIIECVIGVVDDDEGNGHVLADGSYIAYKSTKCDVAKGNVVCTYFVYNPDTNAFDDVLMRFDYVIEDGNILEQGKGTYHGRNDSRRHIQRRR